MDTKKLRQKILDLAIRGKLVPQDPNDEPASVLLERIRTEKERLIKEGKIKRSKKSASDTPHYENVPFEIPDSWEWVAMYDLGEIITGSTPCKANKEYYNGNIPFYKPTDLEQGINTIEASDSLTPEGFSVSRQLPINSVLVTCIGATIGKTGLIRKEGSCNQQINAIIPNKYLNAEYIYYSCISDYMQDNIKNNASATTLPILNKNDFSQLLFALPPFSEQCRIVDEIKKWFSVIVVLDNGKEEIKNNVRVAKSKILDLAIHGKLVPQAPDDEPAINLLKRINPKFEPCDNAHYENIPDTWCSIPLGCICILTEGESITNKEYPYIDVKGLRTGNFLTKLSGKYVEEGTTLILVDGENSGEVFHTPIEGYQGSTMKILSINPNVDNQYVLYFVKLYQKELRENKVGSAIPHLNKKMFRELVIPIPPIEEQRRIVVAIGQYYSILDGISIDL